MEGGAVVWDSKVNLGLWARRDFVNCFKATPPCLLLIMGLFAFNKKKQLCSPIWSGGGSGGGANRCL